MTEKQVVQLLKCAKMALESVSLKGDDESFMADDLEDGEILDEEDDVIPNISTTSVAEGDDKKVNLEGSSNSQNVSCSLSISLDKEKTQIDDSKVPSVGTNEKGIRRDSNECVDMHSDDDARRKKKKKKKRHRESDEEERSKDSKRQKRSHHRKRDEENGERIVPKHAKADGEDDDDDEEMMFVRGASPSHGRSTHTNSSHSHRRERKHSRERHRSSPLLQTPSEYSANYGESSPLHSSRSSHHTNTHRRSRSPHNRSFRKVSRSPTAGHDGGQYDDHYESYDSDYERDSTHYRRGVGRGEEAGTRRGVEDRRKRRGRGVVVEGGSRGSSRGVGPGKRIRKEKRGGGRGESTKTRRPERSGSICMFYMQGKCQKGDDCPYSHDAVPPRKLELCKFYLMDCCAKKDKCLYMHKDFPCKYYHTGMKCFSGEKCKFSHGPLNECLKAILLKHLETAPKEILGDFPRLTREGAAAMVLQQSGELEERSSNNQPGESSGGSHGRKGSNGHKIPSLFEIDIPMPDDVENGEGKGKDERSRRSGDSMLEEDDRVEMGEMVKGGKGDDGIREREERGGGIGKRHSHSIHRGSSTEDDRDEKIGHRHVHSRKGEDERRQRRKREEEENRRIMEERRREEAEEDLDERDGGMGGGDGGGKLSIVCEEEEDEKEDEDEEEEEEVEDDIKNANSENVATEKEMDFQDEETSLRKERGESGADLSDPVNIPLHLPKKQRELFMRIQQQQREAESSQEHSGENEDEDEEGEKEENWYSSDEEAEDRSLTDVLKNLSKQPPSQADKSELTSGATGKLENGSNSSESKFSLSEKVLKALSLGDLSQISITPDISKLLSSIREKTSTTGNQSPRVSSDSDSRPAVRDPRRVGPRDPRQQRSTPSEPLRDPRTKPVILSPRPQATPSITYAAGPLLSDHGDVDLRQLPEGDVDLRRGPGMSVVSSKRDTDLRGRQFGDTDLRRMPPGGEMASLPFRPVPPPEPATEIDASINSHPPITFRLIPVSPRDNTSSNQESLYMQLPRSLLPTPDNMGQVQNDPRMRKVLRLDEEPEESLPVANTVASAVTSTPVPIGSPTATVVSTPAVPRVDPRRARPNNPPSPPKPIIPAKDPRTNHQNMGDMTVTNTFTPDPRRASRNTINAEAPIINHPPITPAPHGIFHPNINSGNMMPGSQVMDNMGIVPMNVNSMCGAEMPPHMSMVGEDMGPSGMNRSVGVRGALLMDPIPEYEEYDEEEERMMMYQDGYGGMGAGGGVGRCNNMMMEQMPRRGFFRGRRSRGRGNWDGGRGGVGGHRGRGDRGSWRDSMGGKGRSGRRGHALPL